MPQTQIVFPTRSCSAKELCSSDAAALRCFRDAHPGVRAESLPPHFPYLVSSPSAESLQLYNQVRWVTAEQRPKISRLSDQYGSYTLPLAQFYSDRLLPLQHQLTGYVRENAIGMASALLETPGRRATGFAAALQAYQDALLKVRQAKLDRLPRAQQIPLENQARLVWQSMNRHFQVELQHYQVRGHGQRGTTLRNPQRAINQARDSRSPKPISFSNTQQAIQLNRFARAARFAGSGLLVLDAGLRTRKVIDDYQDGADWQRTATIETVGLSFGFISGYFAGQLTAGAAFLLLGATPVGWVIMLAGGITAGYLAAKGADAFGKSLATAIYDR